MKKAFMIIFFITLGIVIVSTSILTVSAVSASNNTESIGIIGGADGPTAVLITRTLVFGNPLFLALCIAGALCIASAIGWIVTKKI